MLSYDQRKALRRFGRGQTIPGRMLGDPVIRECYDWSEGVKPGKPIPEMNIVEYCDWEARIRPARPVINEYGKRLLAELERAGDK